MQLYKTEFNDANNIV